ncbi:uncharacterized protein [Argopecten irradians]|uniref:uncharacterized protein n=1 Tax=Argopecten irradians TaxID=31199 RepID=UPI0037214532
MASRVYVNLLEKAHTVYVEKYPQEYQDLVVFMPEREGKTGIQRQVSLDCDDHRYCSEIRRSKSTEGIGDSSTTMQGHSVTSGNSNKCYVYKRVKGDIYIKCDDETRGHHTRRSHTLLPNKDGNDNKSKTVKVVIENLQELPTSGKLEIILELPQSLFDNGKSDTHEDQCTAHESHYEPPPGQKTKNCTCRNLAASLFDIKVPVGNSTSSSHHLNIPEMRPRSYSDSKIQVRKPLDKKNVAAMTERRKIRLQSQMSCPVPQITVQDFSDRRKDLQSRLKDESDELKRDLIDSAGFVNQINHYRKNSNSNDA